MSRKVIVVIAEGKSDKLFIRDQLEDIFDEYEVSFSVIGYDIFSNSSASNLNKNILDSVKILMNKEKFKPSDILCILHLADTDGCFIDDDLIIIDESQEVATKYDVNNIIVDSINQKLNIARRNKRKSDNEKIMISKTKFSINKIEIDYQLFYYSRCLEHVLFNEPNPCKNTKVKEVEIFVDNLNDKIENFLATHMCKLIKNTHEGKYIESWQYIQSGTNSLKRATNVSLLFNYLEDRCRNS